VTRTFIAVSRFSAFRFLFATPYFFPSCRDLSFDQALNPVGERAASSFASRSAAALTDSLTRMCIAVSRLSA
jgi:hypothetical protein